MTNRMGKFSIDRRAYDDVVITTPVSLPYVRFSEQSAHWWIGRALRALVDGSGIEARDIDGFCLSSFTTAPDTAIGLAEHLGLSVRWLDHVPLGGASGITGVRRAARAVQSGDCDVVACIGADTNQRGSFGNTLANFSRFSQDAVYPYGAGGTNASFALIARNYMEQFNVSREDLGRIAVAQRSNALKNPNALMKEPLTLDQYMNARPIADPIHLYDCVMPCAGAEAVLVMRQDTARACGIAGARLRGSIERHNARSIDPMQTSGGWVEDVGELYRMAGVGPDDIDVVQTYDDYPVICMMQMEDLGFCKKGEGAEFVRSHDLRIEGDFPHNTSGGQLSCGQAGAGGSYVGLTEAVRQVLGTAGDTQVKGANLALASGFGMMTYTRGLSSCAVILSGERA